MANVACRYSMIVWIGLLLLGFSLGTNAWAIELDADCELSDDIRRGLRVEQVVNTHSLAVPNWAGPPISPPDASISPDAALDFPEDTPTPIYVFHRDDCIFKISAFGGVGLVALLYSAMNPRTGGDLATNRILQDPGYCQEIEQDLGELLMFEGLCRCTSTNPRDEECMNDALSILEHEYSIVDVTDWVPRPDQTGNQIRSVVFALWGSEWRVLGSSNGNITNDDF